MKRNKLALLGLFCALSLTSFSLTSCDDNNNGITETNTTFEFTNPGNITIEGFIRENNTSKLIEDISTYSYKEGDVVFFRIIAAEGYLVNSVKFNGEFVRSDNGSYQVTFVSGTNSLVVDVIKIETDVNNFTFEYNEQTKEATLVSYNEVNVPTPLVVPDTITNNGTTYTVTGIGDSVFATSSITRISLGKSLRDISGETFYDAPSLRAFEIDSENPYFSVDDGILYNKDQTVLISVPCNYEGNNRVLNVKDSVIEIGDYAVARNRSLNTFNLGKNVKTIGSYAFWNLFSLHELILPQSLKTIGSYAFANCTDLRSIEFGSLLETIDEFAFSSCIQLLRITLPDSLKTLGEQAFSNCRCLIEVNFGENPKLETIGLGAFQVCSALQEFVCPSSLKRIEDAAFFQNTTITSIILNEGLEYIGAGAFEMCYVLEELTIPSTVSTLMNNPFSGAPLLNEDTLIISEDNPYFVNDNGVIYSKDGTHLYSVLYGTELDNSELHINEGCEVIEDYACYLNANIRYVYLPSTIKEIKIAFPNFTEYMYLIMYYNGTMEQFRNLTISRDMAAGTSLSGEGVICNDGTIPWEEIVNIE